MKGHFQHLEFFVGHVFIKGHFQPLETFVPEVTASFCERSELFCGRKERKLMNHTGRKTKRESVRESSLV